jgi:hypothetical protein
MDKARAVLAKAKQIAGKCKTWAELSNFLFDPLEGEVVRTFPSAEERAAFQETAEYAQLRALVQLKMEETGILAGAGPSKSGRFVVRLPRSLHEALEREAEFEGTSLNQLVVAKLAVRLSGLQFPAGTSRGTRKKRLARS